MLSRRLAPIAGLSGLILLAGLMPAYAAPTKTPTTTPTKPAATASPTPTSGKPAGKPAGTPATGRGKKTALTQVPVPAIARANAPRVESGGKPAGRLSAALPAQQTENFSMLGVTWAPGGKPDPRIEVRLLQNGAWSDWRGLAADPDTQSEDPGDRPGTAPTFVGDSSGVEVRAVTPDGTAQPTDLKVSLIDPQQLAGDADPETVQPPASPRATNQAPMPPGIISRAGWGADESIAGRCDQPYNRTIKATVVHHTEGNNNYTKEQSPGIVRGIYAYHVQSNGWCDVGYNFLIDKYGQIFEGRRGGMTLPVKGAHAYNWNTDTMGISLMGSYMSTMPTDVQLDAAVRLTAWRMAAYYRSAFGKVTINGITSDVINGHRDVYSTDCPGDRLYAYLPTFRQRVADTMGPINTPIKARWDQLGGAGGPAGDVFVGEAPIANGRVTQFTNYDIFSAPGVRTSFTRGSIRDKYREVGTANSFLGFPNSDEICDGRTGCFNTFTSGGVILWSQNTGAHFNRGAIREKYASLGYEQGWLGYPTTDEMCDNNGCQQDFTGGSIAWSPQTGAKFVRGAIGWHYRNSGGRTGFLGYPTTDEQCDARGCRQRFTGGTIWFSQPTESHWTRGVVGARYEQLGGPGSFLGYPTTDELCSNTGCRQDFTGGTLMYSPPTGAKFVRGTIREKYFSLGGQTGSLGYPTTDEICSDANNCQQQFTGGRILWNRDRGAWVG